MKIVLASHNKKKLAEMQTLLAACCPDAELVLPSDVGIREEPEETGATFLENALIKARFISRCGYIAVADDSGLCVDALHGEPDAFWKRPRGMTASDTTRSSSRTSCKSRSVQRLPRKRTA